MEWIKELAKEFVPEDKMEAFVEGVKKEFPKHAALKVDFNAKIDEINDLNRQLEEMNGKIAELKEAGNPNEELKAKLEEINGEFNQFKSDTQKRENNRATKDTLKDELSKHFNKDAVDLLVGTFNLDELTKNEAGNIVDLETKIGRLKEERPNLVKGHTPETPPAPDRIPPAPDTDYSKMTDEEYFAAQRAKDGGE